MSCCCLGPACAQEVPPPVQGHCGRTEQGGATSRTPRAQLRSPCQSSAAAQTPELCHRGRPRARWAGAPVAQPPVIAPPLPWTGDRMRLDDPPLHSPSPSTQNVPVQSLLVPNVCHTPGTRGNKLNTHPAGFTLQERQVGDKRKGQKSK